MQIVFIHGPAAAGKYTVGSRLSELSGLTLFHNHLTVDLVLSLFEFGTRPFVALRETIWLSAFDAAAQAGKSLIFTFHPESSVRPEFIQQAEAAVAAYGGMIRYVELLCSDETVEQRLGNADRARFGKLTDIDLYREVKEAGGFEFPALPRPLIQIDTSSTQPDQAAEQIWAQLGSEI